MTYPYRILSPALHDTAEAVISWFVTQWGITKSKVKVETPFDPDINFRPTFVVPLNDSHLLCVEVSETVYSNTLASVALGCLTKGLPVKLFVATPRPPTDPDYAANLKAAKLAGVGLLEVDSHSGTMVQGALSLSLAGVRPLVVLPARYRQALQEARRVFRDGDPSKACALVYDELEAATRRFGKRCVSQRLWQNNNNLNLDSAPWASVLDELNRGVDRSDPRARKVTPALFSRIIGVTTHRNDSGHKPKNLAALADRDRALRTRFEGAVDLLKEFLDATASFRI